MDKKKKTPKILTVFYSSSLHQLVPPSHFPKSYTCCPVSDGYSLQETIRFQGLVPYSSWYVRVSIPLSMPSASIPITPRVKKSAGSTTYQTQFGILECIAVGIRRRQGPWMKMEERSLRMLGTWGIVTLKPPL